MKKIAIGAAVILVVLTAFSVTVYADNNVNLNNNETNNSNFNNNSNQNDNDIDINIENNDNNDDDFDDDDDFDQDFRVFTPQPIQQPIFFPQPQTVFIPQATSSNFNTTTTTTRAPASSLVLLSPSIDRIRTALPGIDSTSPRPGDEITYTLNYENIGTGAITSLSARMTLPYEVDYLYSNPTNPTRSGNTLVFNLGRVGANGSGTVTVRAQVRENIAPGTNLNFPATLSYIDPSGRPQSINTTVSAQVFRDSVNITPTNESNLLQGSAAGAGFFPSNVLGWFLTLALILILVSLIKYLFSQRARTVTINH